MSVWLEVGIGIVIVMGAAWLVKTATGWNIYRKSIQTELYSNYFEYAFRAKSIEKLSRSFYFKSEFGAHRICYQIAKGKNEKNENYPQAYVMLLLSSGLYILNIKNQQNQSGNPIEETRYFTKKIREKLESSCPRIHQAVILPEHSEEWKGTKDREVPVLKRKQMFGTIQEDFTKNKGLLSEKQIEELYQVLEKESLEQERAQKGYRVRRK